MGRAVQTSLATSSSDVHAEIGYNVFLIKIHGRYCSIRRVHCFGIYRLLRSDCLKLSPYRTAVPQISASILSR